jgi:hypothetical protein
VPDIDIYCVADHEPDVVMWVDALFTWGEIGITSVTDMVQKVKEVCGTRRKIRELRILGHGNWEGQFFGRDWVSNDNINSFRGELVQLSGLFGREGLVTLGGCQVGGNSRLLLELGDILNVPVRAFEANQRPTVPGDEGREVRCYLTCTRSGSRTWSHIDRILGQAD